MNLELSEVNKILSNFHNLRRGKAENIETVRKVNGDYSSQGETGLSYEVYKTPIDGVYIKLEIITDSYGDDEIINGIEFVKPIQKTVTIFETIK